VRDKRAVDILVDSLEQTKKTNTNLVISVVINACRWRFWGWTM